MNRVRALSFALFISAAACGRSARPGTAPTGPVALPDVAVEPLAGSGGAAPAPVSIRAVSRGRVTVIDVWASWCAACREVTKQVEQLAQQKKGTDLFVVGLDVGEDRATVASFLEDKKPDYPIYLDASFSLPDAIGQRELPAVIVVDREGTIRMVRKRLDPEVTKLVDDLLAAPPAR